MDSLDHLPYEYSYGKEYACFVQSLVFKYHIRICCHYLRHCCQIFWSWSRMCRKRLRNQRTLLRSIDYYTCCQYTCLYEPLCHFLCKRCWMGSWVASVRGRGGGRLIMITCIRKTNKYIKMIHVSNWQDVIFIFFRPILTLTLTVMEREPPRTIFSSQD